MHNTVFGYPPLEFLEDARPAIINILILTEILKRYYIYIVLWLKQIQLQGLK